MHAAPVSALLDADGVSSVCSEPCSVPSRLAVYQVGVRLRAVTCATYLGPNVRVDAAMKVLLVRADVVVIAGMEVVVSVALLPFNTIRLFAARVYSSPPA